MVTELEQAPRRTRRFRFDLRSLIRDGSREWPQHRPLPWELLAYVDRLVGLSLLYGDSSDVVLLYHSVGGLSNGTYPWDVSRELFREQMRVLSRSFEFVDLRTVIETNAPEKRIAVTFDDAFRNVYDAAVPILREFDIPATVFVCSEFVGDENFDLLRRRHGLEAGVGDVVMTAEQLRDLASDDLFTVGSHTATHPDLTAVEDDVLAEEIIGAKRTLEDRFEVAVDRFSYPYGEHDERSREIVETAYDVAVTSEPSLVQQSPDPRRVPRIDACLPRDTLRFEVTDLADDVRRAARRFGV